MANIEVYQKSKFNHTPGSANITIFIREMLSLCSDASLSLISM